jgi:hypothetical protein
VVLALQPHRFTHVDIDVRKEYAAMWRIKSVPTTILVAIDEDTGDASRVLKISRDVMTVEQLARFLELSEE